MTESMARRESARFRFGENWAVFAQSDRFERRAQLAQQSLLQLLGTPSLAGKTFMDIGCGSGLFSLAACRLGAARIICFDHDPESTETASSVRTRYGIDPETWTITSGSVLDETFLASLPQADVVYAWGVLHHTGNMWRAIDNTCAKVVRGGSLVMSIYNKVERRVGGSGLWVRIKRFYVSAPRAVQRTMELGYGGNVLLRHALTLRNPLRVIREYENEKSRGMDFWCDLRDWIGGSPYEFATAGEIFNHVHRCHGFVLEYLTTTHSLGCNQFVFKRPDSIDGDSPVGE